MTPEKGNVILQHLQTSRKILQSSAQETTPLKMDLSMLSGEKRKKRRGEGEGRALEVRLQFS
jgi:hypothetical protein